MSVHGTMRISSILLLNGAALEMDAGRPFMLQAAQLPDGSLFTFFTDGTLIVPVTAIATAKLWDESADARSQIVVPSLAETARHRRKGGR